jgi:hypothetical protein
MVGFVVGGVRCREARLSLCQGTGVGLCILNVSVRICVCGWVRLVGHDPCEGGEWRVDGDGRTGAATGACICHVKEVEKVGKEETVRRNEGSSKEGL